MKIYLVCISALWQNTGMKLTWAGENFFNKKWKLQGASKIRDRRVFPYARVRFFRSDTAEVFSEFFSEIFLFFVNAHLPRQAVKKVEAARRKENPGSPRIPIRKSPVFPQQRRRCRFFNSLLEDGYLSGCFVPEYG
jgi:hypothetical protein